MIRILRQAAGTLGAVEPDEFRTGCSCCRDVTPCIRHTNSQSETEQVIGTSGQNRVALCRSPGDVTGDERDHAKVVSDVGSHWGDRLERRECHRRKKDRAVGLPLAPVAHHPVEEAVGALSR